MNCKDAVKFVKRMIYIALTPLLIGSVQFICDVGGKIQKVILCHLGEPWIKYRMYNQGRERKKNNNYSSNFSPTSK